MFYYLRFAIPLCVNQKTKPLFVTLPSALLVQRDSLCVLNSLFFSNKTPFSGQDYPDLMSIILFKKKQYSLFNRIMGIEESVLNSDYKNYSEHCWLKWLDTRWTNATLMAGSYDNMSVDHKKRCMQSAWRKGIEWGIEREFMLKHTGNNSFGWHPDMPD